jgi:cytochrome c556
MKIGSGAKLRVLAAVLLIAATIFADLIRGQMHAEAPNVSANLSMSAFMINVVNPAANSVWSGGRAEKLTDEDWISIKQAAAQLTGSIATISLGGPIAAERGRANSPVWQEWARRFMDTVLAVERSATDRDQTALARAGDTLTEVCESCHAASAATIH